MAFTVQDYFDLVRLLAEHPEWRSELRRLVLSDEVLTLPDTIRELAEAQRRTEQRVEELTQRLNTLTQRVDELTQRVDALAEAQRRTEQRVEELAEAQRRTEQRLEALATLVSNLTLQVSDLADHQKRMTDRLAKLEGRMLEWEYREKAPAFFGQLLRKTRLARREELADQVEDRLPLKEFRDVLLADLFVHGQPRTLPQVGNVLLVIEVSSVVDEGDVTRAGRRASLLRQAGFRTVPIVAGETITESGNLEARRQNVAIIQNGEHSLWDEALTAWIQ